LECKFVGMSVTFVPYATLYIQDLFCISLLYLFGIGIGLGGYIGLNLLATAAVANGFQPRIPVIVCSILRREEKANATAK
jgi:hypothetical protein